MVKKQTKFRRTVDKVTDGDTFRVKRKVNGSNFIRLKGVDTPEKNKKGYSTAKRALASKIGNKKVSITSSAKGYYGRPIAKVTQNRGNVNKYMSKYSKGGKK